MKQLLNALERVSATPRTFLDKLRVGVAVGNARDGIVLFANSEFARFVGYHADEVMNGSFSLLELSHPDDRTLSAELQRKLVAGDIDNYGLEKRYIRSDGRVVWAKVSVDVIHRTDDETWTMVLIEDISHIKLLEQKLDAVETVATIATWNWSVRSDTTTVSESFNALHGLPTSAPSPSLAECLKLVHPDDRDSLESTISQGVAKRTGYTVEYRIILSNSQVRWLRTTATCLYEASGEVANLVGATIDITDVKTRSPTRAVSPTMALVLKYIDDNWNKPLSLKSLSDRFGISSRSIHNHFAGEGTTPNKYIKGMRLRQARQNLLSASEHTTVTGVALQCGFSNLGHFAKDYRNEYGEAPSDTMKIPR